MPSYLISFHNDMGHLLTTPEYSQLPRNIYNFAMEKKNNKLLNATDNMNLGCRFYILKPGLLNKWTYYLNGDSIELDYSQLDNFNPDTMHFTKN